MLSETINGLDNIYNKTNAPAFSGAVNAVNVNDLKPAQDARAAGNIGNIIPPSVNGGTPVRADAVFDARPVQRRRLILCRQVSGWIVEVASPEGGPTSPSARLAATRPSLQPDALRADLASLAGAVRRALLVR